MGNRKPTSSKDIEDVAFDVLKQSKTLGVFPTPVNKIVQFSELKINNHQDLSSIPKNYAGKTSELLKKALRKLNGVLDRKEKTIYINPNQIESRKSFVKLHEVGHEALPWQREMYELIEEDDLTISLDTDDEFESEANYFASSVLFQLDRFEEEMNKLPLEIGSPMQLAKMFGGSNHATLRRYVEHSNKRCALLILKDASIKDMNCGVRNYFQSDSFYKEFGRLRWPDNLDVKWPFVQDYIMTKKRLHKNGSFSYAKNGGGELHFDYHYFDNTWNAFVLIFPIGEKQRSRTKFIYSSE